MFNLEQIKEVLPKRLKCNKESRYEELADYRYDIFLGYDENNQIYTITRDEKGNLHVIERDFEEEEKIKYEKIRAIGEEMTLSSDPLSFSSQHQKLVARDTKSKKKIILTPSKDKLKKGYMTIVIEFGNKRYSIINNNGNIELLQDEESIKISSDEKRECFNILRKPFEVSLIDRLKMNSISYTENDRLHHIEQTNQYKSTFTPITPERKRKVDEDIEQSNWDRSVFISITPERMREWDEAEK